jgi:hypothetical protein
MLMLSLLEQILSQTADRISSQVLDYVPGQLAALFILAVALIVAKSVRWMLLKMIKGISIDRFLRKMGLSAGTEKWKAPQLAAQLTYLLILAIGVLAALNSFDSQLTTRIIETAVFLFPKLLVAAAIIFTSAWLGRYFGRSTLVWAVNENLPSPRKLAAVVRAFFVFSGVVAAADHLGFARGVFIAAFVLILGGVVLAVALALGLNGKEVLRRYLDDEKQTSTESEERPLWRHL